MIKLEFSEQSEARIIITGKSEIFRANVKEITHIGGEGYMSTIYLINGTTHSTAHLLNEFEEKLKDHNFFRTHKNTLINVNYATGVQITHKERIVNINGISIKVSRRKSAMLKKMLCS